MEIGSLGEWVTGTGELLAVSVALFLPIYKKKQEKKEQKLKVSQMLKSVINVLLKELEIDSSLNLLENKNYKLLTQYLNIYLVLSTDSQVRELLLIGKEIQEIIEADPALPKKNRERIQLLLKKL